MKKILRVLLTFVIGVVAGGGAILALEFIMNGGSVEELKEYVKGTVVPSAVDTLSILLTLYLGSQSLRTKVDSASEGLLKATGVIDSVSESGAKTAVAASDIRAKLIEQMSQNETLREQNEALQTQVGILNNRFDVVEKMLATGFGNLPDLVKSGNARRIYKLMEEDKHDETES